MTRVKEITFVLENCEIITIPGKYIGEFNVSDIATEISRVAMNAIVEQKICRDFFIEIHKDANTEHCSCGREDLKTTVFERLLQYKDICSIEFSLVSDDVYYGTEKKSESNSKSYCFYLSYDSESDALGADNLNQETMLSKNGWLYISIVKGGSKRLSEYLADEEANSPEYAAMIEELYDIGDKYWKEAKAHHEKCVEKEEESL